MMACARRGLEWWACSAINKFCLWCMFMNNVSQQSIFVPFVHGFRSLRVVSGALVGYCDKFISKCTVRE
jgi:hypothetical protein